MSRILEMLDEKLPHNFFRPTWVTVDAFFVFMSGFFYLYYQYGFLETINTFLVGNPVDYKDIPYSVDPISYGLDPWGMGMAFQLMICLNLAYIVSSFVSFGFSRIMRRVRKIL